MNNPKPPQNQPELLPCPFCDGVAVYDETDEGGNFIRCSYCNCSTCLFFPVMDCVKDKLKEFWNRRSANNNPLVVEALMQVEELFGYRLVNWKPAQDEKVKFALNLMYKALKSIKEKE